MTNLLPFSLLSFLICFNAYAGVFFDSARDPVTGMIDTSKVFKDDKLLEGAGVDRSYMEVKSVSKDSDSQVTVTMGDGRKQVYEKDVFHPEKGWKRTY